MPGANNKIRCGEYVDLTAEKIYYGEKRLKSVFDYGSDD